MYTNDLFLLSYDILILMYGESYVYCCFRCNLAILSVVRIQL